MSGTNRPDYPVTPDGRYFVVRGRLWRKTNPDLPETLRAKLVKELMAARRTRDRAGVDKAKRGLGERGPTWWDGEHYNRHLAKNTPYAEWYAALKFDPPETEKPALKRKRKRRSQKSVSD